MASGYLINKVVTRAGVFQPGELLDDAKLIGITVLDIENAGGFVWPQGDSFVATAAALVTVERKRGANEVDCTTIMQNGVLESMRAAGGVFGFGMLMPMPNAAALSAIDDVQQPDGKAGYVLTFRSFFVLDKASTAPIDGTKYLATLSGTGRWVRQRTLFERWVLQAAWFIDPVGGSDEATGADSLHPIKTHGELELRWGTGVIPQVTDVTITSALPVSDPLRFSPRIGRGVLVRYHGTPVVQDSGRVGSLTAVVARNASAQQLLSLADTNLPHTWTTYINAHARIRFTSGPAAGCVCWPMIDNGATVLCSPAILLTPSSFPISLTPTEATPLVGNSYVIEVPTNVPIADVSVRVDLDFAVENTQVPFSCDGLDFSGSVQQPVFTSLTGVSPLLQGCRVVNGTARNFVLTACAQGFVLVQENSTMRGNYQFGICRVNAGASVLVDSGNAAIGVPVANVRRGGAVDIGDACSFNSSTDGLVIALNSGFRLNAPLGGPAILWGTGAVGYGVRCDSPGGYASTATLLITGASGDAIVGGVPIKWTEDLPFANDNNYATVAVLAS